MRYTEDQWFQIKNGQGPCPDKEAPGPDKNASTAKRRRSLTAEVEGIAPLSSFQKEFMDHRNEIRNMLDNYMASLAAQFRDISMEQADQRRRIQSLEERVAKLESLPAQDSPTGTRDANGSNPTAFDVQKKIEELRDEMEEKARRLPNIIVTGLVEQDPPSAHVKYTAYIFVQRCKVYCLHFCASM